MGQGLLSTCKRQTVINVSVYGMRLQSGKAALTNGRKLVDKVNVTIPSTGMIVEEVHFEYFDVTPWDYGGRITIRPIAHHLYNISTTDALIFMMDTIDREYFQEWNVSQFQRLLEAEALQKVPVVVLANAYGEPETMSCEEIAEGLKLDKVRLDREAEIFEISRLTQEAMIDAMLWITRLVRLKDIKEAVVLPVENAVPTSLKKIYHTMVSALKTVFKTGAKDKAVVPPTA